MQAYHLDQTERTHHQRIAKLVLAAVGVVYGDIGTSPLYTLKECFLGLHPVAVVPQNIMGILSMIFWALILVVSIKYVLFMLRVDNRGEGGILALVALVTRGRDNHKGLGRFLMLCGLFGAALFYGDGMITPAISVLSAVEGLEIAVPSLSSYIIPAALLILIGLFTIQSFGSSTVGKLFWPIMVLWFCVLGLLGIIHIIKSPQVLWAMNPYFAWQFVFSYPKLAFLTLGAVVLALTGAEALYADIGHFGRKPISRAWFCFVLPALLLNYFGQGALLLSDPSAIHHPFYLLASEAWQLPLVILATLAAVIASQAVISGAFSLTNQAVQLGYCPRVEIIHTTEEEKRQIYIPQVNWALCACVIFLVLWFESSAKLATAYGIAVTATMLITTILAFAVIRHRNPVVQIFIWVMLTVFLCIDLAFFSANAVKLLSGGWFPLLIALVSFFLMLTWKRGRELLSQNLQKNELPREGFIAHLESSSLLRVPGTAVFLTTHSETVPNALLHNVKHNNVLHETVVFLTIRFLDIPYVPCNERITVSRLSETFYQIVAQYGFKEEPSVPEVLTRSSECSDLNFDMMTTSFFLARETIVPAQSKAMSVFRRRVFIFMMRNATRSTTYFKLPPNRVVEMGTQIEL